MTDRTTEMLALADWIRNGDLAIIHCGELGACDANQRQRDLIETALRASAGAYVEGQRSMQERAKAAVTELDCMYVNGDRIPYGGIPADPESSSYREAVKAAEKAIASLPLEAQESDGGVEARHAATGNTPGSVPGEEVSSPAASFVRTTVQGAAIQSCAGVAPGPSDTPTSGDADQDAPFYGARCPSYPDCAGGCGLGCTHEVSSSRIGFVRAMEIAERGFENWKAKEHNAKWFRRIDGTPIPNDLLVNIAEAFANEA